MDFLLPGIWHFVKGGGDLNKLHASKSGGFLEREHRGFTIFSSVTLIFRKCSTLNFKRCLVFVLPAQGRCDKGWVNYDKSCYWIAAYEQISWDNARSVCQKGANSTANGELVTINNMWVSSVLWKCCFIAFFQSQRLQIEGWDLDNTHLVIISTETFWLRTVPYLISKDSFHDSSLCGRCNLSERGWEKMKSAFW